MRDLLRLHRLTKVHYPRAVWRAGGVLAVDGVSMTIQRRRIFGLVGESGCGKSSLARAIVGLDPPTSGEVWFDGTPCGRRILWNRIQYVFQDPSGALDPRMRVGAAIGEGLARRHESRDERSRRTNELLDMVGLSFRRRDQRPHELSGGQKQRVVLARALAVEPDFLILDEPVSSLDVSVQAQMINLLADLQRRLSLTYLFISHDLNLVSYFCDDIAVMYRGRIVEMAPAEMILKAPLHPYTLMLFSLAPSLRRRRDLRMDQGSGSGARYPTGDLVEVAPGHMLASDEESGGGSE